MPEQPEPVSIELLQDLADQFSNQALPSSGEPVSEPQPGTLDVRRYLERYGRIMLRETTRGESTLHVLDSCVFDPDHAGGEAAIGQQANGLLFYQCFHESCRGKTWREARQIISGNDRLGSFMSTAGNSACATAAENPQQIEIFSFADVLRMPEDTTPPVIEGILYPRESLLITGPAAIGKSTMVLHCCLSIASGRRFLNQYQTTVSRRILLIQGENSFRTLTRVF